MFRSVLPFLKLREGEAGGAMKVDEGKSGVERGCRDPDVVSWRDAEKEDRETERNSLMHVCVCVCLLVGL
jgi:hypothetical protein